MVRIDWDTKNKGGPLNVGRQPFGLADQSIISRPHLWPMFRRVFLSFDRGVPLQPIMFP